MGDFRRWYAGAMGTWGAKGMATRRGKSERQIGERATMVGLWAEGNFAAGASEQSERGAR